MTHTVAPHSNSALVKSPQEAITRSSGRVVPYTISARLSASGRVVPYPISARLSASDRSLSVLAKAALSLSRSSPTTACARSTGTPVARPVLSSAPPCAQAAQADALPFFFTAAIVLP